MTPLLHSTRHCDFNSRFDSILLFFRAPGDSEGAANKNNNLKENLEEVNGKFRYYGLICVSIDKEDHVRQFASA